MTLRWKAFEKSLRARVKYHDARRKMTIWQRFRHWATLILPAPPNGVPAWNGGSAGRIFPFFRVAICLSGMAIILCQPRDSTASDAAMTGLGLWGLAVIILRTEIIREVAVNSRRSVLSILPLTTDRIFGRLMSSAVIDLACLFFEFLCAYGFVASSYRLPLAASFICVPCALIQAALSFSASLWLLTRKRRVDWLFLLIGIYVIVTVAPYLEPDWKFALRLLPSPLLALNPAEWINAFYLRGWIRGSLQAYWYLLPALVALAALPSLFREFRRMYRLGTIRELERRGRLSAESPQAAPPPKLDPAELRRQILRADLLQPMPWNERGPLERLLTFVLPPGQIAIAKAVVISPPEWPRKFFKFAICLVCIWGLHALFGFNFLQERVVQSPQNSWTAIMLNLAIFTFTMLCVGLFSWSGTLSPSLCLLPLRHFELWKVSAKVNGLTLALVLPLSLLVPFSPFGLPSGERGGLSDDFIFRVIILIVCCAFTGAWTFKIHRLGPLKPWLSRIVLWMVNLGLPFLGFLWALSVPGISNLALALLFIVVPLLWNYLCGMLEVKAWRAAASRGAANPSLHAEKLSP